MIKQYFLGLVALVTISGCNKAGNSKPGHLLDEKTFINILADIHSTEAEIFVAYPNQDTAYTLFQDAERKLLKANHVSKANYDSTYAYYSRNPKQFDQLYAIVIDTLAIREVRGSK